MLETNFIYQYMEISFSHYYKLRRIANIGLRIKIFFSAIRGLAEEGMIESNYAAIHTLMMVIKDSKNYVGFTFKCCEQLRNHTKSTKSFLVFDQLQLVYIDQDHSSNGLRQIFVIMKTISIIEVIIELDMPNERFCKK